MRRDKWLLIHQDGFGHNMFEYFTSFKKAKIKADELTTCSKQFNPLMITEIKWEYDQ